VIDTAKYGPWALIAGGSEGVGAEFARLLADAGLDLVLVARSAGSLEHTADSCRRRGVEVLAVQADLSEPSSWSSVAEATRDLEIGLLILVAGANTHSREFLDGDLAEFRRVIELNVSTPLALIHHYGGGCVLGGAAASWCSVRSRATSGRLVTPSTAA
jgi:short-subunit dehydrogenase